eukprot:5743853-Alexandrium_andersonii.AAC.1
MLWRGNGWNNNNSGGRGNWRGNGGGGPRGNGCGGGPASLFATFSQTMREAEGLGQMINFANAMQSISRAQGLQPPCPPAAGSGGTQLPPMAFAPQPSLFGSPSTTTLPAPRASAA